MGEKTEAEGGGNTRRRSERLRKEREAAEAIRRAEAKKPMREQRNEDGTRKTDRQLIGQSDRTPNLSRANSAAAARSAAMAANRAAIEELTARRDDTRNPISRMNLDNQIRELKAGGTPVQTTFDSRGARAGEVLTVGVVRGGRYSGRQGFDPGSGNVRMNKRAGAYQSVYGRGGTVGSGGNDSPTIRATAPSTPEPVITPISQGPSMSEDAARRAMMSSGAGAATRRKYINR